MSIVAEFKEFAVKGNAVEMAVGIIIGASFNKVVNSLVEDVIMPPIGLLLGGVNFENLFIPLKATSATTVAELKAQAIPAIQYGNLISVTLTFLITAIAVFMLVKAMNKMRG